jgi:hypothetical protein
LTAATDQAVIGVADELEPSFQRGFIKPVQINVGI